MARLPSSFLAARIAAVVSLLVPSMLAAQADPGTLTGRVTAGGEAVPGAAVVIMGIGRNTQTRPDGTYRLTLPAGRYEVRVRLIGLIQAVAPSFNFPRTTIGDGTDHIRPATLRSLAPD